MNATIVGVKIHHILLVLLVLSITGVILGGLGTKAYYDNEHNSSENSDVSNLTVNDNLTVKKDATFDGDVTIDDTLTANGNIIVNGSLSAPVLKAPVENGDADLTLSEAAHAGTIVMQTDVSADRTYTIPDPSRAGVTYRLVGQGSGSAADGHDIIINTDGSVFFDGVINHFDTNVVDNGATGDAAIVGVWANGTTHDRLQINVPVSYDITLIAKSSTVWYVTGHVSSATAPAFSAP